MLQRWFDADFSHPTSVREMELRQNPDKIQGEKMGCTLADNCTLYLICFPEMLPHDPVVETGTALEVNCTLLDKYSGNSTANDITFVFENATYSHEPHVTVVSARTAQFCMPNMTRRQTDGLVACHVPDVPHRIAAQKFKVAGT